MADRNSSKNLKKSIADRSNVFYWQTDRAVSPQEAGEIWADRHRYFDDDELLQKINQELSSKKIASIKPLYLSDQTNLGNVNSVRVATLENGEEIIIRNHPKRVPNGYFFAEALAAKKAKAAGLASFDTLAVHEYTLEDDFAFHVIEKLPGDAVRVWLEKHPEDEDKLVEEMGKTMAQIHKIEVAGFGPFDNQKAKAGKLEGIHATFEKAVIAGLDFNLEVLESEGIFTNEQVIGIKKLFTKNKLLDTKQAVLVHNDFADWNLLTDGKAITGILDWDECVAGDPVSDIACWSTFFEPARLKFFLKGYWQVATKKKDFEDKFELLRLRYTISKMTLRIRRYSWEPTDSIKKKIEIGRSHLGASLKYFGV